MLYWVAMLANVVMLIFFGWALTMHGLPDLVSQRIGILLLFVAPALNIAALGELCVAPHALVSGTARCLQCGLDVADALIARSQYLLTAFNLGAGHIHSPVGAQQLGITIVETAPVEERAHGILSMGLGCA